MFKPHTLLPNYFKEIKLFNNLLKNLSADFLFFIKRNKNDRVVPWFVFYFIFIFIFLCFVFLPFYLASKKRRRHRRARLRPERGRRAAAPAAATDQRRWPDMRRRRCNEV